VARRGGFQWLIEIGSLGIISRALFQQDNSFLMFQFPTDLLRGIYAIELNTVMLN